MKRIAIPVVLAIVGLVSARPATAQVRQADVTGAKTGDPNGPGLPTWPSFSATDQRVMYFDGRSEAKPLPNTPQLKALDQYFADRQAAPR